MIAPLPADPSVPADDGAADHFPGTPQTCTPADLHAAEVLRWLQANAR